MIECEWKEKNHRLRIKNMLAAMNTACMWARHYFRGCMEGKQ